jgi:hypothetical protein
MVWRGLAVQSGWSREVEWPDTAYMVPPVKRSPALVCLLLAGCFTQQASCPSPPGGRCDPRNADCPKGYACAMAEVCTKTCEQTSDCYTKVEDGCRYTGYLPGSTLPDGGVFNDQIDDGFCPESKLVECTNGFCLRTRCESRRFLDDGGCDYDLYGPSEFKGNRSQGPQE